MLAIWLTEGNEFSLTCPIPTPSEEASLPYNKPLAPLLPRLRAVKEKIDVESKKNGQGELSYADLEVLAAKVALTISWIDAKVRTVD